VAIIDYRNATIGVIGLGYVGLPLAIEFSKKRQVIGFDIDKNRVDELTKGVDRTREFQTSCVTGAKNLIFTSSINDLKKCKIFVVTVPTPVDEAKQPNISFLKEASRMVGTVLKTRDIVVYESTVFPGATNLYCIPELELISTLKCNEDFYCGYSPERINPGDRNTSIATIPKITSGSNAFAASEVDKLYKEIIVAGTYLAESIEVAEAAKLIENTQRDINIAFMNEISIIFNRLGIDTKQVIDAASTKWNFIPFNPGLVGGHCIGVDPYYLIHLAEKINVQSNLTKAARSLNENMSVFTANEIVRMLIANGAKVSETTIGVLGVTFKENCPDLRNSKVFELINELKRWGANVIVADPIANKLEVESVYGVKIMQELPDQCCDALIVAVSHDNYREMKIDELIKLVSTTENAILGDLKGIFDKNQCEQSGLKVFRL